MKKIFYSFVILFTFLAFVNAGEYAVINMDEVIKNSTAMIKASKELEKNKSDVEKKLKIEEDKLTKEKEGLESSVKTLAQDVAQNKVSAFQQKVFDFQQKVKDEEMKLQKSYTNVTIEIINNIKLVIEEMKKEDKKYNFKIVIPTLSLPYYDKSLDISSDVLSRLNKKLKEVETLKKN